ncbi:MAG: EAL domain-containing protein [Gammaproteobacteria bacterium]|nr:EAL domain-containing protein [Gammaproteobacteria bacterium]
MSSELALVQPAVLLVDDEPDERLLIRRELEVAGMLVHECNSGEAALEKLSAIIPDVILLDVMMPGLDGIETCREIRKHSDFKDIPVLMLTGVDGLDYIRNAFDAGATDFITKTTKFDFVAQRIKYALRNNSRTLDLKTWQQQLKQVHQVAKIGYWQLSVPDCRIVLSDEALKLFAIELGDIDNSFSSFLDLIHLSDRDKVKTVIDNALFNHQKLNVDYRVITRNGAECFVNLQGEVTYNNGSPASVVGLIQDITERKKSEASMQHQALYDSLTDLSNRRLFQERLSHAMSKAHREEKLLAVCFFDLDNFKLINDNLGHAVGDELLKSVAKRLRSTMRQGDIVARISGDEFALAIEGLSNVDELEKIVEKLRFRLSQPYRIRGHKIFTSASIGIALYPLDSADRDTMLRNADAAMYRAKELGGNCFCYYTYDMNDRARRRLELEKNLRKAISNNELCMYYQPQIDSDTNLVIGVEALLRWRHPEFGLLPPSKFMSIADDSGLIFSIGHWAFITACNDLLRWRQSGYEDFRLSINMSSRQFVQEGIIGNISQVLRSTRLNPNRICVEITEEVAMKNISGAIETMNQLRSLGLRTAIDDFGAGHSSMNLLQKLPIDSLNIDRSFIMRIAGREQDGNTAKGIIALAHSLGLKVVAEGVETKTQAEFLRRHRCDVLQGYYFSPPVPANEIDDFLQRYMPKNPLRNAIIE